ncbi:MAG TPA: AAA family ATPase, partial [Anaerolineae bacterium]
MIRLKRLYANDFKQLKEIDLVFPDAGRILVRGKNEAGKSTLFEAVFFALFGQPLITESGARSLADLVGYGHEQCRVELDVQIRDTLYKIERNVKINLARNADTLAEKREGTQKVALTVVRGDEAESVEGIRAVNARLERELGFDAETLLNTCFVEQKKLDKLETTARKEREHALAKLLNLDALVELEQDLEVTRDDRDRLARLEMRWELARAQAELPPVEEELAQVERALNLAELKNHLVDAGGKVQAINSLNAELEQARPRANEAVARAERAQLLREAVNEIKNGVTARDANARQQEQLEHERAEAIESERQDRANAPRFQAQIQELVAQVARANRLAQVELIQKESAAQIEKWQARLGEVQDARVRADEITARMQSEKARFDDLQARLRDYQLGAALDEWVQANSAAANGAAPEALDAKRRERQLLEARARRNLIGSAISLLLGAIISFAAFFVLLGLRFDLPVAVGISAVLFVLTLVLAAFLIVRTIRAYLSLTEAAQQLGQMEKQDEAASSIRRAAQERIQKANAQFAVLGVPVPRDAAFAQARRVELAPKLSDKSQSETSQELQNVQVNLIALAQKHQELAETSRDGETETLSRQIEQCREVQRHAAQVLDKYGAPLGGQTAIDLNRSLDRARVELEGLQARLNKASQRAAQFDSRGEMLQAGLKEILATVTRAVQVTGIPSPMFADGLTADSL